MAELETVDDVLAHYGVKGMRWGVRRSAKELAKGSSAPAAKSSGKPKWQSPPSKAKGVMDQPAPKMSRREARRAKKQKELSKDAVEFIALKQKAKKQGLNSLTNDDLKKLHQRLELQQKVSKVTEKKPNLATRLILEKTGKKNLASAALYAAPIAYAFATAGKHSGGGFKVPSMIDLAAKGKHGR